MCAAPCCAAAAPPLHNPSVHPCAQRCGLSVAPALVAWPALVDDPSTRERSVLSRAAVSHCVRAGDSPRSNGIRAPLARPPCARAHAQPGGATSTTSSMDRSGRDSPHGAGRRRTRLARRATQLRDAAAQHRCVTQLHSGRHVVRFWGVSQQLAETFSKSWIARGWIYRRKMTGASGTKGMVPIRIARLPAQFTARCCKERRGRFSGVGTQGSEIQGACRYV